MLSATQNNFHLLRLLLAVLVMLSHGNWVFGTEYTALPFHSAELAVNGFFIISGFLISWSIDRRFEWKPYSIKRFTRIYPLYALMIFLQLGIMLSFSNTPVALPQIGTYLLANLSMLNFLQPWVGDMVDFPFNGSLWTIKIEVMFYAALPVYILFCKRFGLKWIITTWILAFLYRHTVDDLFSIQLARQLPGAMSFFIAGYVMYHHGERTIVTCKQKRWVIPACAMLLALAYLLLPSDYGYHLAYLLTLMIALYFIAFYVPVVPIKYDISYGVYLIHFPAFVTLRHVEFFAGNPQMAFLFGGLLVVLLSFAANLWIEEPAIRWGHKKAKNI